MNVHWAYILIVCLLFSGLVTIIGGLLYTIKCCRLENDFLRSDLEKACRRAKALKKQADECYMLVEEQQFAEQARRDGGERTVINTDELKRLRDLCDVATPGPWYSVQYANYWDVQTDDECGSKTVNDEVNVGLEALHNNNLMAESRTAIPALLDEIERLKKLATRLLKGMSWCEVCGKAMEQEEKHD